MIPRRQGKTRTIKASPLLLKLRGASTRFVLSYGGAGSGKSHTQGIHEVLKCLQGKEKVLILRKVGTTLKDSVIPLITEQIIPEMGIGTKVIFNKTKQELTFKKTGAKILFRGLDDPEKIKSIAGVTRIWMEEASEFTKGDFDQLNLRLRAQGHLQVTLTFNPIDESHWIKKRFFTDQGDLPKDDPDVTIFKTTYLDNPFLPRSYIRELLKYKKDDFNFYRVYALGAWGKLDSGAELYKSFSPARDMILKTYNPSLPILMSFDENVNPHMTATLWQGQGSNLWQIDELIMYSPKNNLPETCLEFKKRYRLHESGLVVYGDATSKKDDAKLERGYNFYNLVRDHLKDYHPSFKVPAANPSVMMRALFINEVFRGNIPGVDIKIGAECHKTIEDFKYIKEAPDGTKLKEKVMDPVTKVRYEPYGHATDSAEYLICEYFKKEFKAWQRGPRKSVNYLAGQKKLRTKF